MPGPRVGEGEEATLSGGGKGVGLKEGATWPGLCTVLQFTKHGPRTHPAAEGQAELAPTLPPFRGEETEAQVRGLTCTSSHRHVMLDAMVFPPQAPRAGRCSERQGIQKIGPPIAGMGLLQSGVLESPATCPHHEFPGLWLLHPG